MKSQAPPTPRGIPRSSHSSPLLGKLFDESGIRLTPKHAVKNGKRYRYYVSRRLAEGSEGTRSQPLAPAWRLPAREIERIVSEAIRDLLSDPGKLTRSARDTGIAKRKFPELIAKSARWDREPLELIDRVDLGTEEIAITIHLRDLLTGEAQIRHAIPTTIRRRGVEARLVIDDATGSSGTAGIDPALLKAIVRGRQWFEDLASGRARSVAEIAKAEKVTDRYVARLLPLAFLAPDIVKSILAGTQPIHLTLEVLTKHAELPMSWGEQRALLGFD